MKKMSDLRQRKATLLNDPSRYARPSLGSTYTRALSPTAWAVPDHRSGSHELLINIQKLRQAYRLGRTPPLRSIFAATRYMSGMLIRPSARRSATPIRSNAFKIAAG